MFQTITGHVPLIAVNTPLVFLNFSGYSLSVEAIYVSKRLGSMRAWYSPTQVTSQDGLSFSAFILAMTSPVLPVMISTLMPYFSSKAGTTAFRLSADVAVIRIRFLLAPFSVLSAAACAKIAVKAIRATATTIKVFFI